MPPLYWWKYEMIDRMKEVSEVWAQKMMEELEYIDHASSEPYQKEVQHLIDVFNEKKSQRKEKLNYVKANLTNGDNTDPNSSVAIDVSDTQVRSSLNSLKKTNLSPTIDPNVEEKEAQELNKQILTKI